MPTVQVERSMPRPKPSILRRAPCWRTPPALDRDRVRRRTWRHIMAACPEACRCLLGRAAQLAPHAV